MFYPTEAIVGRIEDFGNGVTREFAHNGHIVIVTRTGTTTDASVDTWFDVLLDTYRKWEPGKPLLLLSDTSDPTQGITAYSRQRAQDFTNQMRAGIPVYIAMVLP